MFLRSIVSEQHYQTLYTHFGRNKLTRVNSIVEKYLTEWELDDCELIPYFSVNVLFKVHSKRYGQTVLKINTVVDNYTIREIAMLEAGNSHYCVLYHYCLDDGVMLLRAYNDYDSLHHIPVLEQRLQAFLNVYEAIHVPPNDKMDYPSYGDLLANIKLWATMQQCDALLGYIDEAINLYDKLKQAYSNNYVLHGDLHHDNILYRSESKFVVIDPKGVIDIRLMDIPRFIINELESSVIKTDRQKIVNIIKYLAHKLKCDATHIAMSLCIESILSITWNVQDGIGEKSIKDHVADHLYCRSFLDKVY